MLVEILFPKALYGGKGIFYTSQLFTEKIIVWIEFFRTGKLSGVLSEAIHLFIENPWGF
ncbi:MAG: hypothetical protein HGB23_06955 [Chlorobiaceae bacterium]|nr:hypothetical protein [Chlorobiaceae bacterium]